MSARWLNLYLRYSGYVFALKQKIVQADSWTKSLPYAVILIFSEFGFVVISLPLYLAVAPKKLQERGKIFPGKEIEVQHYKNYTVRRKISLTTIFGAGGVFLFKIIFVAIVSAYLLGVQQLLADTQDWTMDTAGDFTYDSGKIEVTGGVARLKDVGTNVSGVTTNPSFDINSTGWTYADWGQGGGEVNITGSRIASGGNPSGYININAPAGSGDELGGYWRQAFTTTENNPTATVNFDWLVTAFDNTPMPATYKVYVFVDSGSGVPTIGQEVWSSGEITATTGWASVSNLDVSSKVTTAGTYYLKVAVWLETLNTSGPFTAGFDNVQLNWSKTTHVYASDSPTIYPNNSLTMPKAVSWNSFTETATKNGGEIYYQLSDDDGATWKYWNINTWTTAGAGNYNIATDINTNIPTFSTSTNQIKWKAFLSGSGSQQVILDNISITYTQNQAPNVQNLLPAQNEEYGYIYANYNLQDTESDPSSLATYEYSLTGAFAGEQIMMAASTTDPNHNGVSNLATSPAGTAHTFVWDAKSQLGGVYNANVYVRMRANDGIRNGGYSISPAFAVDYVSSTVSNVVAIETLGTTNVQITYDLFDNTSDSILVEMQVSDDGGATWDVPVASVTGAIGAGQSAGNGKMITWNAGTDYYGHQKNSMLVRIRAKDKWQNQSDYTLSANFSLDTLTPVVATTVDLKAQPNAGDSTILLGGSFTEVNPNTNDFYADVSGAGYGAATPGATDTATPSNQATNVTMLTGADNISKVKVIHTDDYGLVGINENTSPNSAYKYVKPYTPGAPILANPITTNLNLTINPHVGESGSVEYAILETTQNKYVQADGTLGENPVWEVMGTGVGQWGNNTGVLGKVNVNGLSSPLAQYIFKVKSRNPNDATHSITSESAFSATAQIPNTMPSINLNTYNQTTDGLQYVNIAYTGTDGQGDISNVTTYQYSTDNAAWNTMTEKAGVGSSGVSNLVFLPTGSSYSFAWNSGLDLPNIEDSTVYVRLKPNDTQVDGATATSLAFEIDNRIPAVASVSASQNTGAKTVAITYNLTDANSSLVEMEVSSDGGASWVVVHPTVSGAVGNGVAPGDGKIITWNAGTDFDNQYNTVMRVRVKAKDTFGNQGAFTESANFIVDTKAPTVSNVTASQDPASTSFTFHYDIAEDSGNSTVVLAVSADGGTTWTVPVTSVVGDVGAGIVPGVGKTITWNGATDYNNQEKANMKIRITATDSFTNSGNNTSSDFALDTKSPRVTGVVGQQTLGGTIVGISYDLADLNNSLIEVDLSADSGATWTVSKTTLAGDLGNNIVAGNGKNVTWNAGTDYPNQNLSTMKVRVRGTDIFGNQSSYEASVNFSLDTLPPAVNVTADLKSQPNAGDSSVLVGGSFTEAHPDTNNFYVALNGGVYGVATAGTANTASPVDQAIVLGASLKGNDYISKVKIVHADDYNQSVINENTSPNSVYKYVKPYTPAVPTVDNPSVGTVDVTINKNVNEIDGLEYAIYENTQGKYIQANGTLGANAVWLSVGKITVNGLVNPSYQYQFQVKSRNISDVSHAISSESSLSSSASSANQSPVIIINSAAQTTDGTKYVTISYMGSDLESETVSLSSYQYSLDNSTWYTMTEKTGVGSDGVSGLSFAYPGTAHNFKWDVNADIPNTEDATAYVRLRANDGTTNGGYTVSSAFVIDTKVPNISDVTSSQTFGSHNVAIGYNLSELSVSNIELNISSDSGASWTVPVTAAVGDLGSGIPSGNGKTITWNALTDFANQEVDSMRVRLRGTDAFGNQSNYAQSINFALDTKAPIVSNVTAAQNVGDNTFTIVYDLADQNDSNVVLNISSDGGATWNVPVASATGAVGAGVVAGNGKTIIWDGGADFSGNEFSNMRVRVQAIDSFANTSNWGESVNFSLDTKAPVLTNVTAIQTLGTGLVTFTYDLFDLSNSVVDLDISSNGGITWTVATSSLTGAVGSGVVPGVGKTIVWDAGTDFADNESTSMRVRIHAADGFSNYSAYAQSSDFALDNKAPTILTTTDLQVQPNAGDQTVLIGASFTEINPNTNNFSVAINGGEYNAPTAGQSNTATPNNQATAVGAVLTGHDYISKVRVIETDTYGHSRTNENTSPDPIKKYVKPYTPLAPTVDNPNNSSVDLTINPNLNEVDDLEYAIFEIGNNKYVQTDGSLGASAVWKTLGVGAGQWGQISGIAGKVVVQGLVSPVANYSFQVKSRNPSDVSHAVTSESNLSSVAAIINTAPNVSINSASQQLVGNYVLVNYTGIDSQNDTNDLNAFEYSVDNIIWHTMTEKAGVGSAGTDNLLFTAAGTNYVYAWDVATDLLNQEQPTVYVRLKSNDGIIDSNQAGSSAFNVDTLGPVISNISIGQDPGSSLIKINYDLADSGGIDNQINLQISDDGGVSWTVAKTSLAGDVGSGLSAGAGKQVTWDASVDYNNQENLAMQVRLQGTDRYGNVGSYVSSANFAVDTKVPVVSAVSASQNAGTANVTVNYTLSDAAAGGHLVEFNISDDGGVSWDVVTTTRSGDIGAGQSVGNNSFVWNAGVDYPGHTVANMRVRVRAKDYFGSQGDYTSSGNFVVDTKEPVISNIIVAQDDGAKTFVINYSLNKTALVDMGISSDGGATWTVATTTATGDIGAGITTGNKTIAWNAAADYNEQEKNNMRVRLSGVDIFGNSSIYYESGDFILDTGAPLGLSNLSKFSNTETTLTLNWTPAVDANFDHYELWYGAVESDVNNRALATAKKWSVANDANLSNALAVSTVITGVTFNDNYYVKIWAIDEYGSEATISNPLNVYTLPTPTPVATTAGGGGGAVTVDAIAPNRPVLSPLSSPTRSTSIVISGLAEPRARIDLYDNGVLVERLRSVADANGNFSQRFTFAAGNHVLTVRAVDFSDNVSVFSDSVTLNITPEAVASLIILSPKNNEGIITPTPTIVGVAAPESVVEITIDGARTFTTVANQEGAWQFILPSTAALSDGTHDLTARFTDRAGNRSPIVGVTVNKVVALTTPTIAGLAGATGEIIPISLPEGLGPTPPTALIRETTGATELAGIPVPKVENVNVPIGGTVATNDLITFAGTSLPNQDVVVYVHSDQALIYRAHTDNQGKWAVNHSQSVVELSPGEHTVYAVAVDQENKVKSRPSAVSLFTVKRNFWALFFSYLNLRTTLVTTLVLSFAILWLYRIRKKEEVVA